MKRIFQKIFAAIMKCMSRGLGLSRFGVVSTLYGFIYSQLKETEKIAQISVSGIGNFQMYLDERDSLRLSVFGIYEEFEVGLLPEKITKGDVVVDVGANIGYYTILFSKLVGETGKVFAFEPDPINFGILKKNIVLNNCENVVLAQKAVSNKSGKLKLYVNDVNRGDHRIYDSGDGRNTVEIEAVRLDDAVKAPINFLKMDVQGAEIFVLEGAEEILQKSNNVKIFSEFWPTALNDAHCDPADFFSILKKLGFSFFDINYAKHAVLPIEDTDAFVVSHSAKNDGGANIFATKQ